MQGSLLLTYLVVGLVIWAFVTLGFLYSLLIHRNDIADIMWGLSFVIASSVAFSLNEPNLRSVLVMTLVSLWGIRLALHIHRRNKKKKEEDYRYAKWRKEWGKWFLIRSYLQVYVLQGFLAILVVSPALFIFTLGGDTALTMLDIMGVIIWMIGFLFEAIGDYQLTVFMKEKKPKGMIMQRGLWKYTRHPNYFGEVTQWWGIWLMAVSITNGWISLFGPLTITYLILYVSGIPMLEDKLAQNPDYKRYMRRTSKFFPLPPKPF